MKKKVKSQKEEVIDTRRPTMFSDEPAKDVFKRARTIQDLKNLGPETEKAFLKAGVKTPDQFVKLGWKKMMVKLIEVNPKNHHSLFAYALIGALKNQMWNKISDEDKTEVRAFMKELKDKRDKKSKKGK